MSPQIMKRADAIKRGIHKSEGRELALVPNIGPAKRQKDVVSVRIDTSPEVLAQIDRDIAAGIISF